MRKISVILGSGFSYCAGLPLAKDINSYFERDNSRMLLHFSSDEWKWYDLENDINRNNGIIGSYDRIAYGHILNGLVNSFIDSKGKFTNYEEFYQYVIDNVSKNGFLKDICENAKKSFDNKKEVKKDNQIYDIYTSAFSYPYKRQIYNLINYLIGELLYWRIPFDSFKEEYDPFLTYISHFQQQDIITLNHDLLIEALFQNNDITCSDGFSKKGSLLQTDGSKPIQTFNGLFNTPINLIKLHGSIDVYKYDCFDKNGKGLIATEEFIYFKTHVYNEKQRPMRIDPKTKEIVQDFHWNITPQFITGTKKQELIESDYMYKILYNEFANRINKSEEILIVGYSYGDTHVNNQIEHCMSNGTLKKIININPSKTFPFKSKKYIDINNIQQIKDLE
ncbi:MAG: SIR2 family protein [bacterium]|nr:SIR2 family protein [bacterium]